MILGTAAVHVARAGARASRSTSAPTSGRSGASSTKCSRAAPRSRGDTITDTLAAIVEREPDWLLLPTSTPANIRRLLRRCLEKDVKRRCRDIGDARADLVDVDATLVAEAALRPKTSQGTARAQRRWQGLALAAGAITVAALGAFVLTAGSAFGPAARRPERVSLHTAGDRTGRRDVPFVVSRRQIDRVHRRNRRRQTGFHADAQFCRLDTNHEVLDGLPGIVLVAGRHSRVFHRRRHLRRRRSLVVRWSDGWRAATGSERCGSRRNRAGREDVGIPPRSRRESKPLDRPALPSRTRKNIGRRHFQKHLVCPPRSSSLGTARRSACWSGARKARRTRRNFGLFRIPQELHAACSSGSPRLAESRLSWAPDNRHIVWNSAFPTGPAVICTWPDTARATIRQITFGTVNEQSPSLSPDGKRIAFAAGSDDFDLIGVPLDGSAIQALLASSRSENGRRGRQTGVSSQYVTDAQGTPEIWVRSVEEGWTRPIVKRDSGSPGWVNLHRPSFSPDGQRDPCTSDRRETRVWVSSVADGRGVPLDPDSPDQHSPPGRRTGDGSPTSVFRGAAGNSSRCRRAKESPPLAEAAPGGVSPRRGRLRETGSPTCKGTLRLTSTDGLPQKTLKGSPPAVSVSPWTDRPCMPFARRRTGRWVIVAFDVRSEQERSVTDVNLPPKATLSGFSLHPNGKSFATGIGIARHDIWLLRGIRATIPLVRSLPRLSPS